MAIICPKCKPTRTKTYPCLWVYTKVMVVESRRKASSITKNGKRTSTFTMMRRRECLHCGTTWKTIEIALSSTKESRNDSN